jgi:aspartate/methionine/tyrosine aminotransferase
LGIRTCQQELEELELFENYFAAKHEILLVNDNPYSFVLNDNPMSLLQVEGARMWFRTEFFE